MKFFRVLKFLLIRTVFGSKPKKPNKQYEGSNLVPQFLLPYMEEYTRTDSVMNADKLIIARSTYVNGFGNIYSCYCDFDVPDKKDNPTPKVETKCTVATIPMACKLYPLRRR